MSGLARANEYRLLDADRLDFEYLKLDPDNRDPYVPEYTGLWREQIALDWDLTVLQWGYWNNRVHTETTNPSGRVTTVGWQWEAGVHLSNVFDVFHSHHSRHIMEEAPEHRFDRAGNQFPVENAYGIRVHLLRGRD